MTSRKEIAAAVAAINPAAAIALDESWSRVKRMTDARDEASRAVWGGGTPGAKERLLDAERRLAFARREDAAALKTARVALLAAGRAPRAVTHEMAHGRDRRSVLVLHLTAQGQLEWAEGRLHWDPDDVRTVAAVDCVAACAYTGTSSRCAYRRALAEAAARCEAA